MPFAALKHAYDSTLLDNTQTLVQVETALRNVTWFLPGRFQDAELASEGVYSALSLVSLYHDSIISRRLKQVQRLPVSPFARPSEKEGTDSEGVEGKDSDAALGQALPLPSDHTRYTEYFSRHSSTYRTASRALVVIGYVQLLLEMMVVRGRKQEGKDVGRWKRWKLLVWLEGVKTALRISLLIATKRPVLPFPLAQREIDPSVLTQDTSTQPTTPSAPHIVLDFPLDAPAHAYLTPLVPRLPEAYQADPRTLLPEIQGWREWLGEGMQASEGLVSVLVYAVLASRRRRRTVQGGAGMMDIARENRWTSTIPLLWVLLARTLRRPARGTTPLLAETYGSRDRALMFHLVRGAIWQRWTRGKVMRLVQGLEKVWGVRLVAGIVRDHVELVDEYYYYTAT